MATKPATAFTWATNANYSSGALIGNPTKVPPPGWPVVADGFVPGEAGTAETMNEPLHHLGDWSGWLLAGSSAGAADAHIVETNASGDTTLQNVTVASAYKYTSHSVTRAQSMSGAAAAADEWFVDEGASWLSQIAGGNLVVPLDRLPHGCTLQEVHVTFEGSAGHANDPVTGGITMPVIELWKTTGEPAKSSLGSQADTETVRADYEDPHLISLTGVAEVIDHANANYALSITAEGGGDFIGDGRVWHVQCVFDVAQVDEG